MARISLKEEDRLKLEALYLKLDAIAREMDRLSKLDSEIRAAIISHCRKLAPEASEQAIFRPIFGPDFCLNELEVIDLGESSGRSG